MPIRDLESTFVTEEDSRLYASQQILLFLSVPEDHDDHQPFTAKERARESLVPFDKIPPDAFSNNKGLFRWTTRPIYDIDGLLLFRDQRSEEHTSELQSPCNLVCRLLLEKKKDYSSAQLQPYRRLTHPRQTA